MTITWFIVVCRYFETSHQCHGQPPAHLYRHWRLVGEGGHVRHYAPKWPDHAINEQQGGGVGRARVRVVPHDVSYWPNLTTSKPPTLLNKSTFWPSFVWRKKTACFVVTAAGALEESGMLTFIYNPQSRFSCHRNILKSYLKVAVHFA